jgi:hypothetical protein
MLVRRVEDPATVAWKLSTGAYYKAGGRPWQLAGVRPGVCYVGLVYKRTELTSDQRQACCAAQMFLSTGEGVVFRGALARGSKQTPNSTTYAVTHSEDSRVRSHVRVCGHGSDLMRDPYS